MEYMDKTAPMWAKKEFVLEMVKLQGTLLNHAAGNLRSDRQVVMAAWKQNSASLQFAGHLLKADQSFVQEMLWDSPHLWKQNSSPDCPLWAEEEFVLKVVRADAASMEYVDKSAPMWAKKEFVLEMVKLQGTFLNHAADNLRSDRQVVMAAVKQNSASLQLSSHLLKADLEFLKTLVADQDSAHAVMQFAGKESLLWADQQFVMHMFKYVDVGSLLDLMNESLQNNKEVWIVAVQTDGMTLEHAPPDIQADENVVQQAVASNGNALKYASDHLRSNQNIVRTAVRNSGTALQFARGGLNQDSGMLRAAGLWDEGEQEYEHSERAIMSVKFSLGEASSPYATEFALTIRQDPFLGKFKIYNPNAFEKKSCDPSFTNFQQTCRGTQDTCKIPPDHNLSAGKPTPRSCWRFAFRFHQQECKETNGFMLQAEEKGQLGAGQLIETDMARQVGLKMFKTFHHGDHFDQTHARKVSETVQAWYASGCRNKDMELVSL